MNKLAAAAAILSLIFVQGTAMATTPVAGQPIQLGGGNQLADIAKLLPALFGNKQTASTNAGDVSSLQQLIAQLQGTDYNSTLQSIFQQAGGQIPGLQAAFSNAVGARSGGNSAVQAALSKLMMETTLAGQKQVADQKLQGQQIQAQAGGAVAQATKGTQSTQKEKGAVGEITALLGLVQAAKMATGARDIEELGRKLGLGGGAGRDGGVAPVTGAAAPIMASSASPITGAAAPQMSMAPAGGGFNLSSIMSQGPASSNGGMVGPEINFGLPPEFYEGGMSIAPGASGFNLNEIMGGGGMSTPINSGSYFNSDMFSGPEIDYGFGGDVDAFDF